MYRFLLGTMEAEAEAEVAIPWTEQAEARDKRLELLRGVLDNLKQLKEMTEAVLKQLVWYMAKFFVRGRDIVKERSSSGSAQEGEAITALEGSVQHAPQFRKASIDTMLMPKASRYCYIVQAHCSLTSYPQV